MSALSLPPPCDDPFQQVEDLPSPALARYAASCRRKSRPTHGLNVGALYITRTHLVFQADFVNSAHAERRVQMPWAQVSQVRKARHARLLPHSVVVRREGGTDYLFALGSRAQRKEMLAMVGSVWSGGKDEGSSVSAGSEFESEFEGGTEEGGDSEEGVEQASDEVSAGEGSRRVQFTSDDVSDSDSVSTMPMTDGRSHGDAKSDRIQRVEVVDKSKTHLQRILKSATAAIDTKVRFDRQEESLVFCLSVFILLLSIIGVFVALHLLQLRLSVIASRLSAPM